MTDSRSSLRVRGGGTAASARQVRECLTLLSSLAGGDHRDPRQAWLVENALEAFLREQRQQFRARPPVSRAAMTAAVRSVIDLLGGSAVVRAHFPQYRNGATYRRNLSSFRDLLLEAAGRCTDWPTLLDTFGGSGVIPAMTIHKSKGLEYHAVIFVGLEDDAWARFADLDEEGKCTFFVAFSRAKRRVVFTSCDVRASRATGPIMQSRARVASLYDLLKAAGAIERSSTDEGRLPVGDRLVGPRGKVRRGRPSHFDATGNPSFLRE